MRNILKFDQVWRNGGYSVVVGTDINKIQDKKGKNCNCGLVWMDGGRAFTCVPLCENALHVSRVNRCLVIIIVCQNRYCAINPSVSSIFMNKLIVGRIHIPMSN